MATTAAPRRIPPRNDATSKVVDIGIGVVVDDGPVVMLAAVSSKTQQR